MKKSIIFLLSCVFGVLSISCYSFLTHHSMTTPPKSVSAFSLQKAPLNSIKGKVISLSGDVNWLSRTATQSASLENPRIIQQGEELSTGENGTITVDFPSFANLSLSSDSHVSMIQLLPTNFVFNQYKGTIVYDSLGKTTVSVISPSLLTNLKKGTIEVSTDQDTTTTTVTAQKGTATVAYEDSNNQSNVITILEGQQFIFDTSLRQGSLQ
jgi:hypothetical protein